MRNGTGFFYSNPKDDLFLITNRHVIKDESSWYIPNIVRLSLHTNRDNLRQNRDYDIPLYDNAEPRWREPHPFADVVAIPLDREDIKEQGLVIESFSDVEFDTKLHLEIGEDILVMGYPLGCYYDNVFNLPVIRSGTLASAYPVPYQGKPHFLIDARLHKGTSGSPVITKLKNLLETIVPGQVAWRRRTPSPGIKYCPIRRTNRFAPSFYTLKYHKEHPLRVRSVVNLFISYR